MDDVAVIAPERLSLVLRYADVGVATYASLRVVGQPDRTVTWVIDEPDMTAVCNVLASALPDPQGRESRHDAVERALRTGAFATPAAESGTARALGAQLVSGPAWQLLIETVSSPRATLFVSPSARLARVPWSLTAMPGGADLRLIDLVDVLMAAPANIANAPRSGREWDAGSAALLVLDPRVPGQRPDSALGSVLGRPSPDTAVTRYFATVVSQRPVLPRVDDAVELFRRSDTGCAWLVDALGTMPGRLLYVGHATAADDDGGHAALAALHLADPSPLTAAAMMSARLPMPPRVALIACASGGDYRFDEATGLVAAMVLGGARVVTATLWSLPTTAGYRLYADGAGDADPMAQTIMAVDRAHEAVEAGCSLNEWQRAQLGLWRTGDLAASPLYWAALVTYALDGVR